MSRIGLEPYQLCYTCGTSHDRQQQVTLMGSIKDLALVFAQGQPK